MEYKILSTKWRSGGTGTVGIVAIATHAFEGEWKAYIGIADGLSEQTDEQKIAAFGAALSPEEAQAFFPHLDISKYKAY